MHLNASLHVARDDDCFSKIGISACSIREVEHINGPIVEELTASPKPILFQYQERQVGATMAVLVGHLSTSERFYMHEYHASSATASKGSQAGGGYGAQQSTLDPTLSRSALHAVMRYSSLSPVALIVKQ